MSDVGGPLDPDESEQNEPLRRVAAEIDARAARRSLLDQIARLESDLAELFCDALPREGFDWGVAAPRGSPPLSLAELERVRDALASRLAENRLQLDRRALVEERNRGRIEHMLLEPEQYKWEVISNADIGESGARRWVVRPRYGIIGRLLKSVDGPNGRRSSA